MCDVSCCLSSQIDAFFFACVCVRVWRYYMKSVAKIDKGRTRPTVPGARVSLSVSARGLGGTRTLTLFMVREEDLGYDPAHPWPPMVLIQSGLWGVLQHLEETENKTERMKTVGVEVDSLLPELWAGGKYFVASLSSMPINPIWIWNGERREKWQEKFRIETEGYVRFKDHHSSRFTAEKINRE